MNKQRGFALGGWILIGLWVAVIGGWIANVVKFVGMLEGGVTAMFVARIVGMVLAPLGVILGYV